MVNTTTPTITSIQDTSNKATTGLTSVSTKSKSETILILQSKLLDGTWNKAESKKISKPTSSGLDSSTLPDSSPTLGDHTKPSLVLLPSEFKVLTKPSLYLSKIPSTITSTRDTKVTLKKEVMPLEPLATWKIITLKLKHGANMSFSNLKEEERLFSLLQVVNDLFHSMLNKSLISL